MTPDIDELMVNIGGVAGSLEEEDSDVDDEDDHRRGTEMKGQGLGIDMISQDLTGLTIFKTESKAPLVQPRTTSLQHLQSDEPPPQPQPLRRGRKAIIPHADDEFLPQTKRDRWSNFPTVKGLESPLVALPSAAVILIDDNDEVPVPAPAAAHQQTLSTERSWHHLRGAPKSLPSLLLARPMLPRTLSDPVSVRQCDDGVPIGLITSSAPSSTSLSSLASASSSSTALVITTRVEGTGYMTKRQAAELREQQEMKAAEKAARGGGLAKILLPSRRK